MRALRVVLTAPAIDEDLGFVPHIEEFPVQQLISQLCSVMSSFRQASAISIPLPASISTVRRWQMISSAVYRVRAMPPPFVGWNANSRPDLVYRGQVSNRDRNSYGLLPGSAFGILPSCPASGLVGSDSVLRLCTPPGSWPGGLSC
jgi:hypothetical protein